jgi:glycosyltransferase involved in cell wall biosynthesis
MSALLGLARRRPVINVTQNVESSYDPSEDRPRRETALLRRTERRALELASESWMVSHRDMELARELAPKARLRYVPNVVDVEAIEPVPAPGPGTQVLMVADFLYPPNISGAEWLVREVMPRVWERLPGARLRLVGRESHRVTGAEDPRIERPGFVEDLRSAYLDATAVAVPLVAGGGTPLKLVEALAYGVPIAATPVASRGLVTRDGDHLREAATPDAFAAALVDLLEHGDAAMATRARRLVEREYSMQTLVEALADPVAGRLTLGS